MRPIVNMPEEDRATDIGNMHKKLGKDRSTCGPAGQTHVQIHRQTDTHADIKPNSITLAGSEPAPKQLA